MRYINKELPHFKKRGEDINYAFLSEAYNEDDSCYYGLYYDDFKHFQHKRKDAFIELLREEQYDLCCYCMKNIFSDNNITLEHIIPQSCNKKKIRFYQTNSDVLNKYVELTEEFIKSDRKSVV